MSSTSPTTGSEQTVGYSTPVQCRRKVSLRGGRKADKKFATKLAAFQQQSGGDESAARRSMADYLAYHSKDTADDSSVRSAPVGSQGRRQNLDDSPTAATVDETLSINSEAVVSPAASACGSVFSRYGKPEDFIQNTPGSARRRSFKPQAATTIHVPNSAPSCPKPGVSSLRNIKLPLMDTSGHSHRMDSSTHSTTIRRPPQASSAGAAAGYGGYGKPDAFLSTPVSKQRKSWRPKTFSESEELTALEQLPPAFKASISPKRHSIHSISPRSAHAPKTIDLDKIERVPKRAKSNLNPKKMKRRWPPVVESSDKKKMSSERAEGVVPDQAVKSRRTNYEKTWKEIEKTHEDPVTMKLRGSSHSAATVGSRDFMAQNYNSVTSFASCGNASGEDDTHTTNFAEAGKEPEVEIETKEPDNRWGNKEPDHRWGGNKLPDRLPSMPVPHREVSMRIRWGGNTFHTIEGRPLYFEDKFPTPPGLGALLEDRFAAIKTDGMMSKPRRQPSLEWSDDGASRDSHSDHEGEGEYDSTLCPDVWITPMDEHTDVQSDLWRVRRVWNVDDLDTHEVEHAVEEHELVDVVKALAGVSDNEARNADGEKLVYDPTLALWRAKTVYDYEGEIDESSPTVNMCEQDMRQAITEISTERAAEIAKAAEIKAKFSYEKGQRGEDGDDDEWNGKRIEKSHSKGEEPTAKFSYKQGHDGDDDDDDEWQGKHLEKNNGKANGKFSYEQGHEVADDDDEWQGKHLEKNNGKANGKFSYNKGSNGLDDDDDEWHGKHMAAKKSTEDEKLPHGKFTHGHGNSGEDDEDDDWNGNRIMKNSPKPSKGGKAPDAKFVHGSGIVADDDADDEWNGKKPTTANRKHAGGKFSYGAGDSEEDDNDWNGTRVEKTDAGTFVEDPSSKGAKCTYGAGEIDGEDGDWNGKKLAENAKRSPADERAGIDLKCSYGAGDFEAEDDVWKGNKVKKQSASADESRIVGDCDDRGEKTAKNKSSDANNVSDEEGSNDKDSGKSERSKKTKRKSKSKSTSCLEGSEGQDDDDTVSKEKSKEKSKDKTKSKSKEKSKDKSKRKTKEPKKRSSVRASDDVDSDDQSTGRRPSTVMTPEEIAALTPRSRKSKMSKWKNLEDDDLSANGDLDAPKDKKKRRGKKKKDKDYDHGMVISDLLAPPPTKMFLDF